MTPQAFIQGGVYIGLAVACFSPSGYPILKPESLSAYEYFGTEGDELYGYCFLRFREVSPKGYISPPFVIHSNQVETLKLKPAHNPKYPAALNFYGWVKIADHNCQVYYSAAKGVEAGWQMQIPFDSRMFVMGGDTYREAVKVTEAFLGGYKAGKEDQQPLAKPLAAPSYHQEIKEGLDRLRHMMKASETLSKALIERMEDNQLL